MVMGGAFLNFNLTMLNLWIGLCRGVSGLPRDLRRLSYEDKWIEWTFSNQDLKPVCPDLVVASEKTNHTVLLEFKSGANTEPDQLWRYSRVTQSDLRSRAFISRDATHSHDVAVVGKSEFGERLRIGIANDSYPFPLLLADEDGLALDHNEFRISQLNSLFSPRLEIDWGKVPSRFVPIDRDSELWEVAEVAMPMVLHYMTERRPIVRVEGLCQDICTTWDIVGRPARNEFRSKIRDVLHEAIRRHFKPYLRWMKRGDSMQITANPLDLQPDKRTAAYRRLRTAQEDLIEDLRTEHSANSDGQLKLPLESPDTD
jgi:hypothetical protein